MRDRCRPPLQKRKLCWKGTNNVSEIYTGEIVIDDANYHTFTQPQRVGGELKSFGMNPELWQEDDKSGFKAIKPFDNSKLIPWSEMPERIRQAEMDKTRLSDLRMAADNGSPIKSLDQNGVGYCWNHSVASGCMLARAYDGQPYVRLSPFAVGCALTQFRDRGGWNPWAAEFVAEHGIPDVEHWPERSMSRDHDTDETWANARLHRVVEAWWDMERSIYDRNLSLQQLFSALLAGIPCPCDFGWWRHSVLGVDVLDLEPSRRFDDYMRYGLRIWNSWSNSWGALGMGVLKGNRIVPDGATALVSSALAA